MTTKIGIVGLGQIGSSIGLALKARNGGERLVGHDRSRDVNRRAEAMGAVDASGSLRDAVQDAGIVFLCLPLSEIRGTLVEIAPLLTDNAVVAETAPSKLQVIGWIKELLPTGRHYLGIVPSVNPSMLAGGGSGIQAAHAELFRQTVMMLITVPGAAPAVEELGMNFARLVGAKPMLTDPVEADGIMTTAHLLPQLTAAALIEACMAEGGWQEARKLAGRPFTAVSGGMAHYDDPVSAELAAFSNPVRVAHGLDILIAALQGLRNDITGEDAEMVRERLLESYRMREAWLNDRNEAAWLTEGNEPVDLPGLGEAITRMFFGGRIADAARGKIPPRQDQR